MLLSFAYDPHEIVGGWRPGLDPLAEPAEARLGVRGRDLVLIRIPEAEGEGRAGAPAGL